jgi:hypothetical protein
MSRYNRTIFTACAIICSFCRGQISTATINGTVKDATSSFISGAAVEAKNAETGLLRTTATDSRGAYVLADLPVGHYQIRVTSPGFKAWVLPDIEVQISQHATVDVTLDVGALEQQVTVEASAPLLNTVTSQSGRL